MEEKGKETAKVKVRTLVSRVLESVAVDVLWDTLQELQELHAEVQEIRAFSQHSILVLEGTVMDWSLNHLTCFLPSCKPFPHISGSDCL